jgi:hypothetical protein
MRVQAVAFLERTADDGQSRQQHVELLSIQPLGIG